MKDLAKILVTASIATLLGMSSTADAKGSKKSKAKRATPAKAAAQPATPASDVPWYEQGIDDLTPSAVVKPKEVKRIHKVSTSMTVLGSAAAPSINQLGNYQRRTTLAPSGLCTTGCDKTARNISMANFKLVKDSPTPKTAKIKKPKAAKPAAAKKVSRNTKVAPKK